MILQALKEYYDRKAALADSDIAPPGWERKELPFLIVIDQTGTPISIDDTREGEGKKKRAKTFLIPQAIKRASNIAANLLWDNPEYALGLVIKGRPDRVAEQHKMFCDRIAGIAVPDISPVAVVLRFLAKPDKIAALEKLQGWEEIKETAPFLSFRVTGDAKPVFNCPDVAAALMKTATAPTSSTICLVTGAREEPERLHPAIKGIRDANSTGANIVSFNLDAFESFGKKSNDNATVGKTATFAYSTALNTLLGKDSRQKLQVGDATTVFWASKPNPLETLVCDFFSEPPKDNPDQQTEAVKALYKSVDAGTMAADDIDTRFYVLGLSPNAARISIRFWHCGTVAEMSAHFRQHFDDLRIAHGPKDKDTFSLWRLLVSTAPLGKSENIPPNLAGDTMRAILEGLPYPQTLLQSVIRRIIVEHDVTHVRAALIKACLNRSLRSNNPNQEKELAMSLDLANTNPGYRLGRLFAVLERIQERANPGINATIRDRFYGAASGTPVTVFGNLMRLKNHHLSKLENTGERINYEKLIGEIMSEIGDFPAHLPLADQGRFAIGYYHQKQDFFTKKSDTKVD
jgi:CRISPR-associated protein Csd1